MRAKKGGHAVQRLYRARGRTGPRHPAHYAAKVGASVRGGRRQKEHNERPFNVTPSRRRINMYSTFSLRNSP
jgi:hypothetical protein